MSNENQSTTLSKDKLSFQNNDHGNELREKMYNFFKEQTFCDIIIKTDQSTDIEICAHRLVLSSHSEYFLNIFVGKTQLANQTEIIIENITEELLKKIVEYCYTGRLEVENNKDLVEELLNKARYFQIKFLEEACIKWLMNQSLSSALEVYQIYSLKEYSAELREKLLEDLCGNFLQLYESEQFLKLSADKLAELIAQDNIRVQSEENMLDALLAWLNYNFDEREQHIGKLLPLIRFPFVRPAYISSHLKAICRSKENMKLMLEALEWHNVPANRVSLDWICTKKRHLGPLIMIIGDIEVRDEAKFFEVYDPELNQSVQCDIMPKERTHFNGIAATVMDDELIVAGGYEQNDIDTVNELNTVFKLNLANMTWSQLPSMLMARATFKLMVLQHKIYAVAGEPITNTVECWDPTTNIWKFVSAMSTKRCNHSAIELDNKLYALGGYDGNDRLSSVECYDANLDKWTTKASMIKKRAGAGVGVLNGLLYIISGEFSKNSVERYDAKADKWILLHTIDEKLIDLRCTSLHNYIIGAINYDDITEIVKYDPVANEITTLYMLKFERWCNEVLVIPSIMLSKFQ